MFARLRCVTRRQRDDNVELAVVHEEIPVRAVQVERSSTRVSDAADADRVVTLQIEPNGDEQRIAGWIGLDMKTVLDGDADVYLDARPWLDGRGRRLHRHHLIGTGAGRW